jgi:protein phosphatase 2C family protein 2/3
MNLKDKNGKAIQHPIRVLPGRLSVSRTFGDCSAKMEKYGGMPGCVVATPEIDVYYITPDTDYILLASDGVFDHLDNTQIGKTVMEESKK